MPKGGAVREDDSLRREAASAAVSQILLDKRLDQKPDGGNVKDSLVHGIVALRVPPSQ